MLTGHAYRPHRATAVLIVLFAAYAVGLPGVAEAQGGDTALVVTVTDAASGKPLAGVSVTGYSYSSDVAAKDGGTTDDAGRVTLKLRDGTAEVTAFLEGYDSAAFVVEVKGETAHAIALTKIPDPDATVTGRVVGPDGAPIGGARVTAQTWCCSAEPMPVEEPTASDSGAGTSGSAPSSGVAIAKPYWGGDRYEYKDTTTDADGRFTLSVWSGSKQLTYQANGFAAIARTITVQPGANDVGDVHLEKIPPRDAILVGRVIDRVTGAPVPYAGVNLNNMEWGDYNWTQTDEKGNFRFATYPGYVRLDVYAGGGCVVPVDAVAYEGGAAEPAIAKDAMIMPERCAPSPQQYYSYATTLDAENGENRVDVKLAPKPKPTLVVTGYVVSDGKAIPGAWVNIRNEDTGEWGHAITDEYGSYKFLVRPGYLVVEAGAQGYFANLVIVEAADAKPVRADVELRAGETKNGGCYDCVIMYDRAEPATAAPAPDAPATATSEKSVAETGGAGAAREGAGDDAAQTTSLSERSSNSEGAASYQGSGGNLGPYEPGSANVDPVGSGANPVPSVAFGAALLAIGIVAVALARRR